MKLLIISLVTLLMGSLSLAAEVDPERLLQEADDWRWPLDAGKVATRVQAYKERRVGQGTFVLGLFVAKRAAVAGAVPTPTRGWAKAAAKRRELLDSAAA